MGTIALGPTCPNLHPLPNYTPTGECTPFSCALEGVEITEVPAKPAKRDPAAELQKSLAREAARDKLLNIPQGLKGADAENYVQGHLVELSVRALAELEAALRFGNEETRRKTAKDILAATGHGPREAANLGGALINIILPPGARNEDGTIKPLWRRRKAKVEVVDGEFKETPQPVGQPQLGPPSGGGTPTAV